MRRSSTQFVGNDRPSTMRSIHANTQKLLMLQIIHYDAIAGVIPHPAQGSELTCAINSTATAFATSGCDISHKGQLGFMFSPACSEVSRSLTVASVALRVFSSACVFFGMSTTTADAPRSPAPFVECANVGAHRFQLSTLLHACLLLQNTHGFGMDDMAPLQLYRTCVKYCLSTHGSGSESSGCFFELVYAS